ncbi:hypothetical protein MYX84_05165 [Acidobacteria bacterium AH-259-O06]|nr:hypothetical protein [Acidobacteria bacterium AH-259-O06]
MPKICYIDKNLSAQSLAIIHAANEIIEEYAAQGFVLTLRQLYYQFVARAIIPNTQRDYKRLGSIINGARLTGLIDWDYITDRTRNLQVNPHWSSPASIVQACAESYAIDKWKDQPYRPEVWIEKDALVGVIAGICEELDVPYFSCRGYTSQSEMWSAAMRLREWGLQDDQIPIIFHLGDHDPSGKDMTRDITDRLELFMGGMEVKRLALNWDQIDEFSPPPNPAKVTDSRAAAYIAEFGHDSWELDALEPAVLVDLIESAITSVRDDETWSQSAHKESTAKSLLNSLSKRWTEVVRLVSS